MLVFFRPHEHFYRIIVWTIRTMIKWIVSLRFGSVRFFVNCCVCASTNIRDFCCLLIDANMCRCVCSYSCGCVYVRWINAFLHFIHILKVFKQHQFVSTTLDCKCWRTERYTLDAIVSERRTQSKISHHT